MQEGLAIISWLTQEIIANLANVESGPKLLGAGGLAFALSVWELRKRQFLFFSTRITATEEYTKLFIFINVFSLEFASSRDRSV